MKKAFAILSASLFMFTGCISLFPEQNENDKILELRPREITTSGMPSVSWQLVIQRPTAEPALRTTSLMVEESPYTVSYVKGVKFADTLPDVIDDLLLNAFLTSGKVTGVGRLGKGFSAQYLLQTHIQKFQLVALRKEATPQIHLRFAFQLINVPMRKAEGIKIIEVIEQANSKSIEDVMSAFNVALSTALSQALEWALTTP